MSTMKTLKDYQKVQPTPGPWEISKNSMYLVCGYDPRCYPRNERHTIARIDPDGDKLPPEVGIANARLIAACPELLAALKEAVHYYIDVVQDTEAAWVRDAQAAIAKAEGTKS